jgi:hypothetical protein
MVKNINIALLSLTTVFLGLRRFIFKKNVTVVRQVTFFFPEHKNFTDFQKDFPLWINRSSWLNFFSKANEKSLISDFDREIEPGLVRFHFKFSSVENLKTYEDFALHASQIDKLKLKELGYKTDVQIIELAGAGGSAFGRT